MAPDLEFQGSGEKEVLLCLAQGAYLETIKGILLKEGYRVCIASLPHDALEKIKLDHFQVVVIEESLGKGCDGLLTTYLENLPMASRRETIYVLIGEGLTTGDRLGAYAVNADLVLNAKDVDLLPGLLKEVTKDHEELYRTFKNILREVGGTT